MGKQLVTMECQRIWIVQFLGQPVFARFLIWRPREAKDESYSIYPETCCQFKEVAGHF